MAVLLKGATHRLGSTMAEKTIDRSQEFVRIESVSKCFGDFVAVDNVSLDIYRGKFFVCLAAPVVARRHCYECWRASRSRRQVASFSMVRIWRVLRRTSVQST